MLAMLEVVSEMVGGVAYAVVFLPVYLLLLVVLAAATAVLFPLSGVMVLCGAVDAGSSLEEWIGSAWNAMLDRDEDDD